MVFKLMDPSEGCQWTTCTPESAAALKHPLCMRSPLQPDQPCLRPGVWRRPHPVDGRHRTILLRRSPVRGDRSAPLDPPASLLT